MAQMAQNASGRWHYAPPYFLNPTHPISVNLIGVGGTGSAVLTLLAAMDQNLSQMGHPGLYVRSYDPDIVSHANVGRQSFYEPDIGQNKAVVAVSRVNRAYGLDWEAFPVEFNNQVKEDQRIANITITCVDKGKTRKEISKLIKRENHNPYYKPYYWLDYGNSLDSGQVVLGTVCDIKQPSVGKTKTKKTLPTILDLCPNIDQFDDNDEPSCSVAQSLNKQDLFINRTLGPWGVDLIWKFFREGRVGQQGVFLSLKTMRVNPIMV